MNAIESNSTLTAVAANMPQLWTVKEAAAYLRKSESWVWQAVRTPEDQSGSIPHAKLGKSPRFIPEEMQAWAASGFVSAADFKDVMKQHQGIIRR